MTVSRHATTLAALLLLSPSLHAHLPEPFGRHFVVEPPAAVTASASSASAPEAGALPDSVREASALERTRQIEVMEDELERLQQEGGAYGGGLTDPLLQLANLYEEQGNAVAALRSLESALHLLRVNNGLLHSSQLPILRRIPELYRRIGDLDSAQRAWRYAYRVNGLGQRPLDDQALQDTLRYFQFARDAFIAPGSTRNPRLLVDAYYDNEALYEAYLADAAVAVDALVAVARSHLRNLYILLGIDLSGAAGPMFGDAGSPGFERLYSLQTLGLGKGIDILDELDARLPDASPLERARLRLERGNWLQWNAKWGSARDAYEETARLLAQIEADLADAEDATSRVTVAEARKLRDYLAAPAALPEDAELWRSLLGDDMPVRGVLSASFRVSERGKVSEVSVTAADDTSTSLTGRLRRLLIDSHFRPALGAAGPEAAFVNARRYRLLR